MNLKKYPVKANIKCFYRILFLFINNVYKDSSVAIVIGISILSGGQIFLTRYSNKVLTN